MNSASNTWFWPHGCSVAALFFSFVRVASKLEGMFLAHLFIDSAYCCPAPLVLYFVLSSYGKGSGEADAWAGCCQEQLSFTKLIWHFAVAVIVR